MFRFQFKKFSNEVVKNSYNKFSRQFRKFSTEVIKTKYNKYLDKFILYGAPVLGFIHSATDPIELNEVNEYKIVNYICNGLYKISIYLLCGFVVVDLGFGIFAITITSASGLLYGVAKLKIRNETEMIDDRNRKISEVISEISKK